jgi:hypothetical protein
MALLDRLTGDEEPKLPSHQFAAAMEEWAQGQMTRAQVIAAFSISASEETQLDAIKSRMDDVSPLKFEVLHNVALLAEKKIPPYDVKAEITSRLGL